MKVLTDPAAFRFPGAVVAIGMFDGVHGGHRRVLARLRELGARHALPTVVLTFDPHPRVFFDRVSAPKLLSTLNDRMTLLEATGAVDHCLVLPFDHGRSQESAEDFVRGTLVARLGIRALVVGEDFACGRARCGNVKTLQKLGAELGFEVDPIRLRTVSDAAGKPRFSSTETRRLIQHGDVERAAVLLGRPHELIGCIVAGVRGSTRAGEADLPDDMCAPPAGAYVGAVREEGRKCAWIPAALQVREGISAQRRTVRFIADGSVAATIGDHVRLRFLSNLSHEPTLQAEAELA